MNRSRHPILLLAAVLLLAASLLAVLLPPSHPALAQAPPSIEHDIFLALNEWRIANQLWPYSRSAALDALALEQASYLQGLGDALPYDRVHDGPDGSDPPARARRAGWPTYGRDEFTAITEIAKVGPDVDDAMEFWTTSSVHLRSISNASYREIGIASVTHEFGYITIVVLGARPDVLPALVDVDSGTLYLSNERYRGSAGFAYLANALTIRLFDASGRPLQNAWIPWQASLPLPAGTGSPLVVAYSDGTRQTVAVVDLARSRVDGPTGGAAAAVIAVPAAPAANQPAAIPSPTPVAAPPPTPTATPAPPATRPDVRIVYDERSLAVISLIDVRQNWAGLELVQGANRLAAMRWNNLGGFPMASVPPRACIQAVDPSLAAFAGPPSGCTSFYASVQIPTSGRFWAANSFQVQVNGQTVATCPATTGPCEVDLP